MCCTFLSKKTKSLPNTPACLASKLSNAAGPSGVYLRLTVILVSTHTVYNICDVPTWKLQMFAWFRVIPSLLSSLPTASFLTTLVQYFQFSTVGLNNKTDFRFLAQEYHRWLADEHGHEPHVTFEIFASCGTYLCGFELF